MSGEKLGNKEESKRDILGSLEKWEDGIDLEARAPKPFDVDFRDVLDQDEFRAITSGRDEDYAKKVMRANQAAMLHNNEEMDKLNERILQIYEMSPDELDRFYHDKETSDSDKSIVACIEYLRLPEDEKTFYYSNSEWELHYNIEIATSDIYGFDIIRAQKELEKAGLEYKILIGKERDEVATGSIEDIVSAAFESFVMNPKYSFSRILDYAHFVQGLILDCTKRSVDKENFGLIKEEIDLEEFQERIMESMSWADFDDADLKKEYTKSEYKDLRKKTMKMYADYVTGHSFDIDCFTAGVKVSGENKLMPIDVYAEKEREEFFNVFHKRVQKNNAEVFRYDEELARAEMKPWAKKIDLDLVEDINNDTEMDIEEKYRRIAAHVQKALGIQNLDENGQSRPIEVKWFRFELNLVKAMKKLLKIPETDDLPTGSMCGFYRGSEKSVYFIKPKESKRKLSVEDIDTVVHEMWHAKQHELRSKNTTDKLPTDDLKVRMYEKNGLSYAMPKWWSLTDSGYYMQVSEREAHVIGGEVKDLLVKRRMRMVGKKMLGAIFSV